MAEQSNEGSGSPRMEFREYDNNYPLVFAEASERIHASLPNLRIEHVGSTSVPGLGGRGVIDLVVIAGPEDTDGIREKLLGIGFSDVAWAYVKPMLNGSIDYQGKSYPLLVYVLPEEHELVRGWLSFRNYMKKHPDEIKRYEKVKREAIACGKSDPWSYQQAKDPYLRELAKRLDWI